MIEAKVIGHVLSQRGKHVKDSPVIIPINRLAIVPLSSYEVGDICGIGFRSVPGGGGSVEIFQYVADTRNPSLKGIGTEKFEFQDHEESLCIVPSGEEGEFLLYHPTPPHKFVCTVKVLRNPSSPPL